MLGWNEPFQVRKRAGDWCRWCACSRTYRRSAGSHRRARESVEPQHRLTQQRRDDPKYSAFCAAVAIDRSRPRHDRQHDARFRITLLLAVSRVEGLPRRTGGAAENAAKVSSPIGQPGHVPGLGRRRGPGRVRVVAFLREAAIREAEGAEHSRGSTIGTPMRGHDIVERAAVKAVRWMISYSGRGTGRWRRRAGFAGQIKGCRHSDGSARRLRQQRDAAKGSRRAADADARTALPCRSSPSRDD